MKVQRSPAEAEQIKSIIQFNRSFKNVFKKDWTKIIIDELAYKLYGAIPRNFLINITGLIGVPTGIFKSTLGLQIARTLDPRFNLKERVAFSINELLMKVQKYSEFYMTEKEFLKFRREYSGTYEVVEPDKRVYNNNDELCTKLVLLTKLLFFLDEQTKTLKHGHFIRLQNLVDTCRQRQICFITCGVEGYEFHISTYELVRIQESHDKYLPKKQVRYGVYDKKRDVYYGYFKWNVIPLTDPSWNKFWHEYSEMKADFQRVAIQQRTQAMDYEGYADMIMEHNDWDKCFRETKEGKEIFLSSMAKALIIKLFPDLTNQEKDTILSEIKFRLSEE